MALPKPCHGNERELINMGLSKLFTSGGWPALLMLWPPWWCASWWVKSWPARLDGLALEPREFCCLSSPLPTALLPSGKFMVSAAEDSDLWDVGILTDKQKKPWSMGLPNSYCIARVSSLPQCGDCKYLMLPITCSVKPRISFAIILLLYTYKVWFYSPWKSGHTIYK